VLLLSGSPCYLCFLNVIQTLQLQGYIFYFWRYVTPMLVISIHACHQCQPSVQDSTRKNVQLHFCAKQKCTSPFSRQAKVYKSIFTLIKNIQVYFHKKCTIHCHVEQKCTSPFSCRSKMYKYIFTLCYLWTLFVIVTPHAKKVYKSIFMFRKSVKVHFHVNQKCTSTFSHYII